VGQGPRHVPGGQTDHQSPRVDVVRVLHAGPRREPFASFIERARHFSVARGDETVSFILRRFASLALNFHRDWVSNGAINDAVPDERRPEVERAVAVYAKVIETWPEYGQAWNRRARAYFLLGDYDKADADLCRALELQPMNSHAWVGRMLVKMKQQRYADALDAYKQAIKLNPALDIAQKTPDAALASNPSVVAAATSGLPPPAPVGGQAPGAQQQQQQPPPPGGGKSRATNPDSTVILPP